MEPDDLLCSRNARPPKVWRKGLRIFLCSRSARPNRLRKNSLGTPELRGSAHEGKQENST